jgi:NAD(P)-dependent dehydrogenase (short-subunit alcohol dehydrogenase family)
VVVSAAAPRPLTLVTGGSRGIGAAVVRRLAGAGHDLVLGYRADADAAQRVADEAAGLGATVRAVAADVTDPDAVEQLFATALDLGALTGVVNNAGATLHLGDLADTPVEVIRQVVELNLTAALFVAREAVRHLGEGGALVNVSSGAATLGSAHEYVHYAAAKAGVDALTLGLAQEVAGRGIRVNGVAPGLVRTDIHAGAGDPGRLERIAAQVPLGRAGEPEEVAEAITWLLSDACPYATGATLRVAGGR